MSVNHLDSRGYNEDELMAVLLSREVRDGEISACGALSQLPATGLLLAKHTHAPDAELIILNTVFRPFHTSRQFHFLAQRGELGLFFVSGVQIDRHGNYNLHQLGEDPGHPTMRFPGGYGGGMIYYCARRTVGFDAGAGELRLESVHPGHTRDEVRANTGFDLGDTSTVPGTGAPTSEELRVLRTVVRPLMIETGTYARWAERAIAAG